MTNERIFGTGTPTAEQQALPEAPPRPDDSESPYVGLPIPLVKLHPMSPTPNLFHARVPVVTNDVGIELCILHFYIIPTLFICIPFGMLSLTF